ncbi:MAG: hypothetical protein A2651_01890 [Candidatus Yanofskybacteria bacterium RIFCSPHIGHO2_01_FULL_42_12]|uniref:Uncharacterized protein n=1 Tax=Candidatus Yanofskybacteria bacterium RIFCSPLOWO2_01_FULL_42_49 TaxID=1802694 RepID=A0A1F8GCM1_9BACT|nr:MAG: hypothetical protein A2651_01890 [Candidatus Yanofskybacteria bacterium RIFCSPHIGHO2_01_FULL_42_12]OGN22486.1 MAG: hypothetical protein A2918_01850 [Candidatus Yanofskybacteria bacterium RIFCSPLOWO2_01_FULL_42_49]
MNQVERARIIVMIDKLEKEKRSREFKLSGMRSDNMAAWNTYGSELCAGGMEADERKIEEEIEDLRRKIVYLKDNLRDDKEPKADLVLLESQIKGLDDEIQSRQTQKEALQDNWVWASFLYKVCSGEQQ